MRIKYSQHRRKAFTLIEMIGVLAVIAILAALLIPKVFEAINNSKINNAAVSYNTVKSALTDHYAKYGTILSSNGTPILLANEATAFDKVLVAEGLMDKPFQVKVGDNAATRVEVVGGLAPTAATTTANIALGTYDLDGNGAIPVNDAGPLNSSVVQAVITGVPESDAKDLNDRLDGATLGEGLGTNDLRGRVKYVSATPTTVYIYVTHR